MANNTTKISKSLQGGLHDLYGQLIEAAEALDARVYKRVYHEIVHLTETVVTAFGSAQHPTIIELRENVELMRDLFVDVATASSQNYVPVRPAQNGPANSMMGNNYYRTGQSSRVGASTARDALQQPIRLDQLKVRRDRLKRLPVTAMSVSMANNIARDLLQCRPEFRDETAEVWAKEIGCSVGTVQKTACRKAIMEATGRGRGKANPKAKLPSERPLTPNILAARPDGKQIDINAPDVGDDQLRDLLESDKDTEEQVTRLATARASRGG